MLEYGLWLSTKYLPSIIFNDTSNVQIPTVLSQRDVPSMTRYIYIYYQSYLIQILFYLSIYKISYTNIKKEWYSCNINWM